MRLKLPVYICKDSISYLYYTQKRASELQIITGISPILFEAFAYILIETNFKMVIIFAAYVLGSLRYRKFCQKTRILNFS